MEGVRVNPGQESSLGVHTHENDPDGNNPEGTNNEGDDSAINEKVSPKLKECNTCCETFEDSDLVKCVVSRKCKYTQCTRCVIKGGGRVCSSPECMYLHFKCPACRQVGASTELTLHDDRFTKKDVLDVLNTIRVHFIEMQREREHELDKIMGDFTRKMSLFADGIYVLEQREEQ